VNSSVLRITNQGKFDSHLEFGLMSSIVNDDPAYKKGIFFIEPEKLTIKVNEVA
jgi:hypothetical protein